KEEKWQFPERRSLSAQPAAEPLKVAKPLSADAILRRLMIRKIPWPRFHDAAAGTVFASSQAEAIVWRGGQGADPQPIVAGLLYSPSLAIRESGNNSPLVLVSPCSIFDQKCWDSGRFR